MTDHQPVTVKEALDVAERAILANHETTNKLERLALALVASTRLNTALIATNAFTLVVLILLAVVKL